jgi:hypothetical protein
MTGRVCVVTRATFLGGRSRLLAFPSYIDSRGDLTALPFDELPFLPQRSFFVHTVPEGTRRGGHSHHIARQLLFCLSGRVSVLMRNAGDEVTVVLEDRSEGLLIEAGVWAQQTYLTENAVLFALASEKFSLPSYRQ